MFFASLPSSIRCLVLVFTKLSWADSRPFIAGSPPFEWAPIRLVRSVQWQKNLDPTTPCGAGIMAQAALRAGTHVGNYGGMLIGR